jgi:hypothetical protein
VPAPDSEVAPSAPAAKSANFISIVRIHGTIKGTYAIDPQLTIPTYLLPPVGEGESEASRKNMVLEARYGSIDVDIVLVGDKSQLDDQKRDYNKKRTTLAMESSYGAVTAKVVSTFHALIPSLLTFLQRKSSACSTAFHLTAVSNHGSVTVYLPRSFQGLLKLSTIHGAIVLSDRLQEHTTTFNEVNSTRNCFVGDFSGWVESEAEGQGEWNGDEVDLSAKHGRLKVSYVDELEKAGESSKGKFFSRIFGI